MNSRDVDGSVTEAGGRKMHVNQTQVSRLLWQWSMPIVVFLVYVVFALYVLATGHPHEDAYILYIFSENLSTGHGITYFKGGDPAEGATDFLWMVILAFSHFLGLHTPVAAALWNGFGLATTTFVAQLILKKIPSLAFYLLVSGVLGLALLVSQVTQASLGGFGVGLYTGVFSLMFYWLSQAPLSRFWALPWLGLALGLLRPDGVIVGVTGVGAGLWLLWGTNHVARYSKHILLCFVLGLLYFVSRAVYFEALLPLPLLVKSASAVDMPGLLPNKYWLLENKIFFFFSLAAVCFSSNKKRLLLAFAPPFALLVAITFATQSQNIAFRFQGPATIALILGTAACVTTFATKRMSALVLMVVLMLVGIKSSHKDFREELARLQQEVYINYLPFYFSSAVDDAASISLTEAGRFAYWMPGAKYDLVGLNTREPALGQLDRDYIQSLNSTVTFLHTAKTVDFSSMCQPNKQYCRIDKAQMYHFLDGQGFGKEQPRVKGWSAVERAPSVYFDTIAYTTPDLTFFLVKYSGEFFHFYAVQNNKPTLVEAFESCLKRSMSKEAVLSYLEMTQTPVRGCPSAP